jgi:hypothetical protein
MICLRNYFASMIFIEFGWNQVGGLVFRERIDQKRGFVNAQSVKRRSL